MLPTGPGVCPRVDGDCVGYSISHDGGGLAGVAQVGASVCVLRK
jgi:hypothetical protein